MPKKKKLPDYEKLGAFYLGRIFDRESRSTTDELLLYDAKDLTTHAVCVGMTGSGKTGLCVGLLEEAAIDGIPALIIDPKGDLGNLMLNFPDLSPSDYRPWVDPGTAARKGQTPDEFARSTAELWRNGLAKWDQGPDRMKRLRDAADVAIYTPGSNAGLPLTLLKSFDAPPQEMIDDGDAFRERVSSAVSGLLTLLGIHADPVRSREHILLSNILDHSWREGRDLDLVSLIQQIQSPPFDRVGVFEVDAFFPASDRLSLAMTLNNLLASPGFSAWTEGEPLDINRLLWTEQGKPRLSILSIAHLGEAERMFFVTMLLNEVVTWMRRQSGTSSLRALIYMDEVFGYLPPSAMPPSKTPLLTLLKQARAYGVGTVLATQNPVDLDYKALSNAGTWFLGRLQTERDKMRVLDGLEGVSASTGTQFNRARVDSLLSGLGSRVFLMNNVHEDEPALFHTRWVMSYLSGPMTRHQIKEVMAPRKALMAPAPAAPRSAAGRGRTRKRKRDAEPEVAPPPVIPADVETGYVPTGRGVDEEQVLYRPMLMGKASLHYVSARIGVDKWRDVVLAAPLNDRTEEDPWEHAEPAPFTEGDLEPEVHETARHGKLPSGATKARSYKSWRTDLKNHVYRELRLPLWKCASPKGVSEPGEPEGDFKARMSVLAREKRDLAVEKLRKKYAPKLARLQDRVRRAEARVGKEEEQYSSSKTSTAISFGATVLGALFGRKAMGVGTVGRAGTTMRGMSRASREKGDIARAREQLDAAVQKLRDMEAEFHEDMEALEDKLDTSVEVEAAPLAPRKSDIDIDPLTLVWTPWTVEDGIAEPAWDR